MRFPEVLARLGGAGTGRYHVDLPGAVHRYYMTDGAILTMTVQETPLGDACFLAARAIAEIHGRTGDSHVEWFPGTQ